jgi:hypothetical protein
LKNREVGKTLRLRIEKWVRLVVEETMLCFKPPKQSTKAMLYFARTWPTIAELKPRIMLVHEGNDTTKYFLSSGFAFIHVNSVVDIIAIKAIPIDRIDPSLV